MLKALLISSITYFIFNASTFAQKPNFAWAEQLDGNIQISSIANDQEGNIYMTGIFSGNADFDPGNGIEILSDTGFGDIFVCKIDPSGDLIWAHQFGGSSYDEGKSIVVDEKGNSYVAGFFNLDSIDFDPGPEQFLLNSKSGENSFVLKLDIDGNFIWVRQIESDGENFARSICMDHQNNLVITGRFESIADFDPGIEENLLSAAINAIYIWKLDNDGNFLWVKHIETNSTRSISIATDGSDNILLSGLLIEKTDLDPGPAGFNLSTSSAFGGSLFMLKLNSSGLFEWAKQIENVEMLYSDRSLLVDDTGNSYYSGYILGTADMDPNSGIYNLTASSESEYFLLRLDSSGNFDWAKQGPAIEGMYLDRENNLFTCGQRIQKFTSSGINLWNIESSMNTLICVDINNNLYTAGHFTGTVDFDSDTSSFYLTTNSDHSNFLLKLSPDAVSATNVVEESGSDLIVYPNPGKGSFILQSTIDGGFSIINASGKIISQIVLRKNEAFPFYVDLARGIYYIHNFRDGTKPVKLIILD